jgi:hypothetical protein
MLGKDWILYCGGPGPSLPNLKTMEIAKSPTWDLTLLFRWMSDTLVERLILGDLPDVSALSAYNLGKRPKVSLSRISVTSVFDRTT